MSQLQGALGLYGWNISMSWANKLKRDFSKFMLRDGSMKNGDLGQTLKI